MKLIAICPIFVLVSTLSVTAQSPGASPGDQSDTAQLETITKKLDEQTAKIDALSQQILKLEQEVGAIRPGVMIGEPTPPLSPAAPAASAAPGASDAANRASANGGHVVAKGETLTSIAKAHKVSVEELQKFNHIENDRKLQIGQMIMLPVSASAASPSPSATASPSPNE
ncbi:MAG: LysM domain-containing protein [Chthoniobacterales bacterium]